METTTEFPIVRCLKIQRRVIHALLLREIITRFGRKNLGVLWFIAEPMIFTVGVTILWTLIRVHSNSAMSVVAFAVTGYSSVLMWRNSASRVSSAIAQNTQLLFHRNVRVIDVLLARIVIEVAGATGSFIFLSFLFTFIGVMRTPHDLLEVVSGWGLLAWFGASLALVIGAGTVFSELFERLWHPLAYIMFPISGAAFMVDWLPPSMQKIVLLLPMVHGIEMLRHGYFGDVVRAHYDIGYMAACNLVLSLVGLFLVQQAGRRVEF